MSTIQTCCSSFSICVGEDLLVVEDLDLDQLTNAPPYYYGGPMG